MFGVGKVLLRGGGLLRSAAAGVARAKPPSLKQFHLNNSTDVVCIDSRLRPGKSKAEAPHTLTSATRTNCEDFPK